MTPDDPDDLVLFDDDAPEPSPLRPWRVLVVDDDPEVHAATRFVVRGQLLLGRSLELHSAHSADEAAALLRADGDFAVVLLDVVMERPDAGLQLVQVIRDDLGLRNLRIILRTGQPGYAPELDVISRFDINDYRTKSELTQTRLLTSLIGALRGYEQIRRIETSRRGLQQIIGASRDLLSSDGLRRFASGVLTQLGAFLGLDDERGLVVISHSAFPHVGAESLPDGVGALHVMAASGHYAALVDHPMEDIAEAGVRQQLAEALACHANVYSRLGCALYCHSTRHQLAVFVDTTGEVESSLRELLEVFTENIAMCSDNLSLMAQLQRAAYVDGLTGMPTRLRLLQRLNAPALGAAATAPDADLALLMVDIDDFNTCVETLGPAASDALLMEVGQRLRGLLDGQPVLTARIGGDVFGLHGPARLLGPSLLQALCEQEFLPHGLPVRLSVCGGLAHAADVGGDAGSLVAAAFTALKRAKHERHQGYEVYKPEMGAEAVRRADLLRAMHAGMQAGEFHLLLQPQLRMSDGAVVGVEALLRWLPDGMQPVSPADFVPVAESAGLILPLGRWVIDQACRAVAELQRRTGHALRVGINVSPAQWRDPALPADLLAAARRHGLSPRQIEIELTETQAMRELDALVPRLDSLRAQGMRVALDDFGTGFSSLAYLQHMPVDLLKIDRSFVHEIGRSRRGEDIARTIIELGHLLGLEVLAEGVETSAQFGELEALGCDTVQGYLHARPMSLDLLCVWLADRRVASVHGAG